VTKQRGAAEYHDSYYHRDTVAVKIKLKKLLEVIEGEEDSGGTAESAMYPPLVRGL
jgi:hypothetical protein